jgi:UDP:flavonoid glycosyltransferase YjiC (YdhE family)
MARMLWLNWSGGGNLPPSLGIARALTERGHTVAFAGRPEMVPRVEAAGFRAIELTQAYAQIDRYPSGHHLSRPACYLTSPAVADELRAVVAAEAPDVALIDGMFPAALAEAPGFGCPTAAVCHTFCFRMLDRWRNTTMTLDGMRQQAGFGGLPALDELWQSRDRIIVTSLAAFDTAAPPGWDSVRHVGPVLEDEKCAVQATLPWAADDATPLVLMSFSTGFEQRSVEKLQRSLDALADLSVHVVATTGGIVAPEELAAPANAIVVNYAAHDPILQRAALAVTHGGHGTLMRSLRHGVTMVVMPGLAHDQALNATTVQEWGAGVGLPGDADIETIRSAARDVLSTSSYGRNAQRMSVSLAGVDGAANAADEIEALLIPQAMSQRISPSRRSFSRTIGERSAGLS